MGASQFGRIAGIAQVQEFGSLYHSSGIDIETGNDSSGQHFCERAIRSEIAEILE